MTRWVLVVTLGAAPVPVFCQEKPGTGSLSGQVQNEMQTGIAGAEVAVVGGGAEAITDPQGRFRIAEVPVGPRTVMIRAIGYLPHIQVVQVGAEGTDLGAIVLRRGATVLPEIGVATRLPQPAFGLGFATNLEESCRGCGRRGLYLPFGASMTGDGLYLALFHDSRAEATPRIVLRMRPVGMSLVRSPGFGAAPCEESAPPLATRIEPEGATALLLYANGAVWSWAVRLRPGVCLPWVTLSFAGPPLGAAGWPRGWVVAVRSPGGARLVAYNDMGSPLWSIPLAAVLDVDGPITRVALAPTEAGVTVALAENPFSWALVDTTGSVSLRSLAVTQADPRTQIETAEWRGHAVLPTRDGFVQTLERPDLREGSFILYDVAGRPVKRINRSGASVLVASYPELRMLLGYQYDSPWGGGGGARLFLYRY